MTRDAAIWSVPFAATTVVALAGGWPLPAALLTGAGWVVIALAAVWVLQHEMAARRVRAESAHDRERTQAGAREARD